MATVELRAERFAAGGEAIARDVEGRIVFLRGAVPGETVLAQITQRKRDWSRGHVVEVLAASDERVAEPCPSRRRGCGGCGWMHLDLAAQRRARATVVADALRRLGGLDEADVVLGGGVDGSGYRTTVRVRAAGAGGAGFRAERSHDVVTAPSCLVAAPALRELLPRLTIEGDVEVTLRTSLATGEIGARWDRSRGEVGGLPSSVLRGGSAVLHEVVAGRRLQVSLGSFFQSGPAAAELLVSTVLDAAPELAVARCVVDAYAGIGVLGACAAPPAAHVVAVETSRTAVVDAAVNLAGRSHEVVRGEVGGWRAPPGLTTDVAIADPARSGLGMPGVTALARLAAPVLVLVSCDPASLGRDAKLLRSAGFRHERSWVIDTFPHTARVEAVSRFVKV